MRKLTNKCVIWLFYLDASKTRREGRRLPKSLALNSPRLEEIVEASQSLNLNPNPNFEARYPRSWWQKSGYVIVDKIGSKNETLSLIAKKIAELRSKRGETGRKV